MERLTYDFCVMNAHCWQIKGADNLECREVCENQDDLEGCKTCPIAKAFNRLAEIENILGDEYDLDRLRELVQADRDGRCKIVPCKIGDPVYLIKNGEIIRNYGVQWHFTDCGFQTFGTLSLYGDFVTPEQIGKTVFFSYEQAEAALNEMKEAEENA